MTQDKYDEYKMKMDGYADKDFKFLVGTENGKNIFKDFRFESYLALVKTKVNGESEDCQQLVVLREVDGERTTSKGLQTLVDFIEKPKKGKLAKNYLTL